MQKIKTESFTFRLSPSLLAALKDAAAHERRSVSNLLEVLIRRYCEEAGIEIVDTESQVKGGGGRRVATKHTKRTGA